uniref:Uncharacterized protein n=1 Tax=Rhizophora mucronata TaxID=61149 RepID=A0A2P2J2N6_RHIMU
MEKRSLYMCASKCLAIQYLDQIIITKADEHQSHRACKLNYQHSFTIALTLVTIN